MEYPGIFPRVEAVVLIAFVASGLGLDSFCLVRAADQGKPVAKRELPLWEYLLGFSGLFRPISV